MLYHVRSTGRVKEIGLYRYVVVLCSLIILKQKKSINFIERNVLFRHLYVSIHLCILLVSCKVYMYIYYPSFVHSMFTSPSVLHKWLFINSYYWHLSSTKYIVLIYCYRLITFTPVRIHVTLSVQLEVNGQLSIAL